MDEQTTEFVNTFRRFMSGVINAQPVESATVTPVGETVVAHLGIALDGAPVMTESMPAHRLADADIALDELSAAGDGRLLGITGGQSRGHQCISKHSRSTDGT